MTYRTSATRSVVVFPIPQLYLSSHRSNPPLNGLDETFEWISQVINLRYLE